jgi:hypothetical protein
MIEPFVLVLFAVFMKLCEGSGPCDPVEPGMVAPTARRWLERVGAIRCRHPELSFRHGI